jgi:hypothetical protein
MSTPSKPSLHMECPSSPPPTAPLVQATDLSRHIGGVSDRHIGGVSDRKTDRLGVEQKAVGQAGRWTLNVCTFNTGGSLKPGEVQAFVDSVSAGIDLIVLPEPPKLEDLRKVLTEKRGGEWKVRSSGTRTAAAIRLPS